jgi:hypothetical protein
MYIRRYSKAALANVSPTTSREFVLEEEVHRQRSAHGIAEVVHSLESQGLSVGKKGGLKQNRTCCRNSNKVMVSSKR